MHFEILVEDVSGKVMLEGLLPKILGPEHTFRICPYRGIGKIPANLTPRTDPRKRILLDQLPRLLRGFGNTFAGYPPGSKAAVFVVCDLDTRDRNDFLNELNQLLAACDPKPETRFCLAIEEGEAWLLGDIPAIKKAYPEAKDAVLNAYVHDSICGTWELLADAIFSGGSQALKNKPWNEIGEEKSVWARTITAHMDVSRNVSPSFNFFKQKLKALSE